MSLSDEQIEQEIQERGLTAPRVTAAHIDSLIEAEDYHRFVDTTVTVCCLTLKNGFTVVGESACADPANFSEDLGKKIARDQARGKIWQLEGYLLRERLSQSK